MSEKLDFNHDFQLALDLMENSREHLFITGRAGSGKSTLLRHFRKTTKKKVVYLAPTGIAAVNIAGQTIHSFFGFPPRPFELKDIERKKWRKMFTQLDSIVIDEISMVRADIMDSMDYFMRINGRSAELPFGGVQLILMGDLFQLPPVVRRDTVFLLKQRKYESPYFFSAHGMEDIKLAHIELTTIYRQEDRGFKALLEQVRNNELDYDSLEYLNSRFEPEYIIDEEKEWITLCATNAVANKLNQKAIDDLDAGAYNYPASTTGKFDPRNAPAAEILTLKIGAQVLFTRNDQKNRWVNGTIGTVHDLQYDKVLVSVKKGEREKIYEVPQEEWEIFRYTFNREENAIEAKEIGSFKQYPLRLAWAITIHKSQGMTFDRLIIDMGKGAFAPGQLYVALSRCRSFEGIVLTQKVTQRDIIVDPTIIEYAADNDIL